MIDEGGIVGRHAGDGVTAFFLAETAGSEYQRGAIVHHGVACPSSGPR